MFSLENGDITFLRNVSEVLHTDKTQNVSFIHCVPEDVRTNIKCVFSVLYIDKPIYIITIHEIGGVLKTYLT